MGKTGWPESDQQGRVEGEGGSRGDFIVVPTMLMYNWVSIKVGRYE